MKNVVTLIVVCFVGGCICAYQNAVEKYVFGVPQEVDDCPIFRDFVANSTDNILLFKVQVPGCSACAALGPKLEELAAQYYDTIFINVNYMEVWSSLLDYNITVVPTCVFVWKSEEVARVMTTNKAVVENQIIETMKDLNLT